MTTNFGADMSAACSSTWRLVSMLIILPFLLESGGANRVLALSGGASRSLRDQLRIGSEGRGGVPGAYGFSRCRDRVSPFSGRGIDELPGLGPNGADIRVRQVDSHVATFADRRPGSRPWNTRVDSEAVRPGNRNGVGSCRSDPSHRPLR